MNTFEKAFPWIVGGIGVLVLAVAIVPPKDKDTGIRYHAAGKLPVIYNGRTKPLDTLARNSLLIVL